MEPTLKNALQLVADLSAARAAFEHRNLVKARAALNDAIGALEDIWELDRIEPTYPIQGIDYAELEGMEQATYALGDVTNDALRGYAMAAMEAVVARAVGKATAYALTLPLVIA